ncbi:MAG TPA: ABC transporter permease [Bacillota bacterium]|nr:ABC transporter permease [Bacillota bacterium]
MLGSKEEQLIATVPLASTAGARGAGDTVLRLARFASIRLVTLLITVVVGVYLTILIANMGGYVDEIRRAQIREAVGIALGADEDFALLPEAERRRIHDEMVAVEEVRLGLDQPFPVRSFIYLRNALTLDFGMSDQLLSDSMSRVVRLIILERLPPTLALFATAQLILFFGSVFTALYLSQRYGSLLDRAMVALAPTSAAPGWFYGIFLIVIFAAILRVLPFGGMVAIPPPADRWAYALSVLRHLILPVTAIVSSAIFQAIYYWRTFFLIHSREDYVEMARAKGLSSAAIERRYILRPTLPAIVTSFALTLIALWMGAIVLETVFMWPGLGRLIFQAIGMFDTPVLVGAVVIYAYLLAVTVFVLDLVYAMLDPRVLVEGRKAG